MAVLADKKITNTSRLRLTIQIDLSGFSFKISNSKGEFVHRYHYDFPVGARNFYDIEDHVKKEFNSQPLLSKDYAAVRVYYGTEKYCLVPNSFFKKDEAMSMLGKLHDVFDSDEVLFVDMPEQKAVLIYAIPNVVMNNITRTLKNAEFYPISYFLLDKISLLMGNNRMLIHFSNHIVHIVAAERDKLLLSNSYPAPDFVTGEYYIFLVTKEVMFNPEHTILNVSGNITPEQEVSLKKYFMGTKRSEL